MEHRLLGTFVIWENDIWIVDNTDENFKDESDETSLFLIPIKYQDIEEYDKAFRDGRLDNEGYWVYEHYVKEVNT